MFPKQKLLQLHQSLHKKLTELDIKVRAGEKVFAALTKGDAFFDWLRSNELKFDQVNPVLSQLLDIADYFSWQMQKDSSKKEIKALASLAKKYYALVDDGIFTINPKCLEFYVKPMNEAKFYRQKIKYKKAAMLIRLEDLTEDELNKYLENSKEFMSFVKRNYKSENLQELLRIPSIKSIKKTISKGEELLELLENHSMESSEQESSSEDISDIGETSSEDSSSDSEMKEQVIFTNYRPKTIIDDSDESEENTAANRDCVEEDVLNLNWRESDYPNHSSAHSESSSRVPSEDSGTDEETGDLYQQQKEVFYSRNHLMWKPISTSQQANYGLDLSDNEFFP